METYRGYTKQNCSRGRGEARRELRTQAGVEAMADATLDELADHLEDSGFASANEELLRQGLVLTWGAIEVCVRDLCTVIAGANERNLGESLKRLFPAARDTKTILLKRGLWLLYQRRHLIVHRRGIVDERYRTESGEALPLGAELRVKPDELESSLKLAVQFGAELIRVSSGTPAPAPS